MKKNMKAIITIIASLALVFANFNSFSQNFKFDTTNATFLKVERNTDYGVIFITLKTNEAPKKEVFNCKNVPVVISFDVRKSKNFGSNHAHCSGMKFRVNKITQEKDNVLVIELRFFKMDSLRDGEKPMLDLLPDSHESPGLKMESVKTVE